MSNWEIFELPKFPAISTNLDPNESQLTKITNTFKSLNINNISFETTTNNIKCIFC